MKISDALDGCDIAGSGPYTADADIPYVVLFAGIDARDIDAVRQRRLEWQELFADA